MDFVSWLEGLPPITIGKLYGSHWACQATLRGLPPLAKLYVLRLVYLDAPVPAGLMDAWPLKHGMAKHAVALDKLTRLQVLQYTRMPGSREQGARLHPAFQEQIRLVLEGWSEVRQEAPPPAVLEVAPLRDALDRHALGQWEALMLYLVGTRPDLPPASPLLPPPGLALDDVLAAAGLLTLGPGKARAISEAGFRFLLLDTYHQLWRLLREYIAGAERRTGAALGAVVGFLLELGFREVGTPFALAPLPPLSRGIVADLAQLGLVLPFRAAGGVWAAPTRLALALASGSAADAAGGVTDGFVVVETNYRVYAYTSSPLQTAILRLFVRCECTLPNLFVGTLTRESVTGALACGLSADAVVDYLRNHAHPHAQRRAPVVPEVVADQIRLWAADTRRVAYSPCVLYDDFPSTEVMRKAAGRAHELGVFLWEDRSRGHGRFAARPEGHTALREYIKSIK